MSVSTPVDGVAKIKPMFLVTATTIAQENCSYPNQRQLTTLACDREPADASASSPKKARNDDVDDLQVHGSCTTTSSATVCDTLQSTSVNSEAQTSENKSPLNLSPSPSKKLSKRERRGQNKSKNRPRVQKPKNDVKLCSHYLDGKPDTECPKSHCNFMHDIPAYLGSKTGGITDKECYIYKTYGKCSRGLTCAFATSHTDCDNRNVVNGEIWQQMQSLYESTHKNILDNETQYKLRSRKYDFKDVEELCNKVCLSTTAGPFTDEDLIPPRVEELRKYDWNDKLYLSPLTTVGNLPFRRLCVSLGADITCSEMSLATSILQGQSHEFGLHRRHPSEKFWGVQLCANNVFMAAKAAQVLHEIGVDYDFVDLNLGCPLDPIYRMGAGSGLMCRGQNKLKSFMKSMSIVLGKQQKVFTVKMRAGVKSNTYTAHNLIPTFRDAGVSMITLHGRTREQRYTKSSDWDYIGQCKKLADPLPIFGNGDILSWEEYHQKKTISNVAGIMIGRGALMKPWIFQEIKEQRNIDMSSTQRLETVQQYVNYGLDHFGSDSHGVETTRRFLLEWLSFFHRYIPFGILERAPQKMNERPPKYIGRDEMETLLASSNSNDWVKISEMFLGKVPDNFLFLPKHKANSWG